MKIATFNINDINKRVANLLDWLAAARPDVACLQELKAAESEFPIAAIERAGYGAVWQGQKSWNGVAILARGSKPIITRASLPVRAVKVADRSQLIHPGPDHTAFLVRGKTRRGLSLPASALA